MKTSLPLLIACVAVVLTAGTASADSAQEIFSRANAAYARGDFENAISEYELLTESGISDPDIAFNLATAHAKATHFGEAIRWYERALILRPGDDDAERGIAAAASVLGARRAQAQGEAVVQTRPPMLQSLAGNFSDTELAVLTLGTESFLFAALIALLFARRESVRLSLGISVPVFLISALFCGLMLTEKLGVLRRGQPAVVLHEHANVRESASSESRLVGEASEGERITVLSRHANFVRVRLPNGREGYLRSADVGEI